MYSRFHIHYVISVVFLFSIHLFSQSGKFYNVGPGGDLGVSIPLMKVPGSRGLELPISLRYNAGIQVKQKASWVGLGWDLEIGSITRSVRTFNANNKCDFAQYSDVQPDLYFVSLPVAGGTMFPTKSNTNSPNFTFENSKPWKVEYETGIVTDGDVIQTDEADFTKFIITTENGTKYIFNMPVLTSDFKYTRELNAEKTVYVEKWMLTAIESPNYKDINGNGYDSEDKGNWIEIKYSYGDQYWVYETYEDIQYDVKPDNLIQGVIFPYSIKTPTHKVQFVNFQRLYEVPAIEFNINNQEVEYDEDVYGLERIKLFSRLNGIDNFISGWKFDYGGGVTSSEGEGYEGYTASGTILFEKTISGQTSKSKLTLNSFYKYYENENFPKYNITYQVLNPTWNDISFGSSNRENYIDDFGFYKSGSSSNSQAEAWSIKSITTPVGLTVEYGIETDQFTTVNLNLGYSELYFDQSNNPNFSLKTADSPSFTTQGGTRLQSVTYKQNTSIQKIIGFVYPLGQISGIPQSNLSAYYDDLNNKYLSENSGAEQSRVYYPQITENIKNSTGQIQGFKEYNYTTIDLDPVKYKQNESVAIGNSYNSTKDYFNLVTDNRSWNWGRLYKISSYEAPNGTNIKTNEQVYYFADTLMSESFITQAYNDDSKDALKMMAFLSKPVKSKNKIFSAGQSIQSETLYNFNIENNQRTIVSQTNSDGTIKKIETSFEKAPIGKSTALINGDFNDTPGMYTSGTETFWRIDWNESPAIKGWNHISHTSVSMIWVDRDGTTLDQYLQVNGEGTTFNKLEIKSDRVKIVGDRNYNFYFDGFLDAVGSNSYSKFVAILSEYDTQGNIIITGGTNLLNLEQYNSSLAIQHTVSQLLDANTVEIEIKLILDAKLANSYSRINHVSVLPGSINATGGSLAYNLASNNQLTLLSESKVFKDNTLNSYSINEYSDFDNDPSVENIRRVRTKQWHDLDADFIVDTGELEPTGENKIFDQKGNLLEKRDARNKLSISKIMDFNSSYPVASISNAYSDEVLFEHFEGDGFNSANKATIGGFTGSSATKAALMDWNNKSEITLYSGKSYSVSYRLRKGTALNSQVARVVLKRKSDGLQIADMNSSPLANNDWILFEGTFSVMAGQEGDYDVYLLSNTFGSLDFAKYHYIDDLRIHPLDAIMTTSVFNPDNGRLLATEDNSRNVVRYGYDALGRKVIKRDTYHNVISESYPFLSREKNTNYNASDPNLNRQIVYNSDLNEDKYGNMVANSGFELGYFGQTTLPVFWSNSNATTTIVGGGVDNTFSIKITNSSHLGTERMRVTGGENYFVSAFLKSTGTPATDFTVNWLDENQTFISFDYVLSNNDLSPNWSEYFSVLTAPATAYYAEVYILNGNTIGETYADNVKFIRSTVNQNIQRSISTSFKNGFGKVFQSQSLKYNPKDDEFKLVVSGIEYDDLGRKSKSYLPIEISENDVTINSLIDFVPDYFTTRVNSAYTSTTRPYSEVKYLPEASGRISVTTIPDFDEVNHTAFNYALNVSGDVSGYNPNSLFKNTITDYSQDNNPVLTTAFKDLFGNTIKTIKDVGGLDIETTYEYDILGRVLKETHPVTRDYESLQPLKTNSAQANMMTNGVGTYITVGGMDTDVISKKAVVTMSFSASQSRTASISYKLQYWASYDQWVDYGSYSLSKTGYSGSKTNTHTISSFHPAFSSTQFRIKVTAKSSTKFFNSFTLKLQTEWKLNLNNETANLISQNIYNTLGQLTKEILPDQGSIEYLYDKNGNLRFKRDAMNNANGKMLYFQYDNQNRVIETGICNDKATGEIGEDYFTQAYADGTLPTAETDSDNEKVKYIYDTNGYTNANNLQNRLSYKEYINYGGTYRTYFSYNDKGQVEWIVQKVRNIEKKIEYTYNFGGAITKTKYDPNGPDQLVYFYHYAEDGALEQIYTNTVDNLELAIKEKKFNGTNVRGQVTELSFGYTTQTINYEYDPLYGWLNAINDPNNLGSDKFAMRLYHDATPFGGIKYYNGNVNSYELAYPTLTGVTRKEHRYDFTYDKLNQLKSATYSYKGFGSNWYSGGTKYKVDNLQYDELGNILTIRRHDKNGIVMNDFYYKYNAGSNQLNGRTYEQTDFAYNPNGSMTQDSEKNLSSIDYNYLKLPEVITTNSAITHQGYTDGAQRLFKEMAGDFNSQYIYGLDGQVIAEYDKDNILKYWRLGSFGHKTKENGVTSYYYLKDHKGNVRVTVKDDGTIISKDDYYPFGMQMAGLNYTSGNGNLIKYSGKELDQDGGLSKYHYGWREYDPELGRWNVIDPARQYASPYVFNGNDPVTGFDPDGREKTDAKALLLWIKYWERLIDQMSGIDIGNSGSGYGNRQGGLEESPLDQYRRENQNNSHDPENGFNPTDIFLFIFNQAFDLISAPIDWLFGGSVGTQAAAGPGIEYELAEVSASVDNDYNLDLKLKTLFENPIQPYGDSPIKINDYQGFRRIETTIKYTPRFAPFIYFKQFTHLKIYTELFQAYQAQQFNDFYSNNMGW